MRVWSVLCSFPRTVRFVVVTLENSFSDSLHHLSAFSNLLYKNRNSKKYKLMVNHSNKIICILLTKALDLGWL